MKSISLILVAAGLALAQISSVQPSGARAANGAFVPQPPQPPSSFDCAVDGSVTNASTGEPIARAHVNLIAGPSAYSATTDASGKWTLSNVACASAQLVVTRAGFIQNIGTGVRPGVPMRPLILVSGTPVHDVKTTLTPQSVVLGKVLDDQGDPVMGAQVMLLSSRVVDGRSRFQQTGNTMTNDLGEYRIASLPRGKYIACVRMNQQNGIQISSQTISAESCYPGPLDGGTASAMDLPAGRETKVDFTLNQVFPVHVRGTVSGLPEGRGIGINLVRRSPNSDAQVSFSSQLRDGKFDFRVPPGSYMLTADYFEAGKRLTARLPVEAGSSDIDNIAVHLDTGFSVTGIVRVISQASQTAPISQFGLNLRTTEPNGGTGQVKWDADHTAFSINEMVPGTYRLDVFPPPGLYVKSATLAGQDIFNSEVPISQAAGPVEIVLRDDGGSIEGDVTDSSGQPALAGIMLLRNTNRATNLFTQPNGHFKIQNVAPGDYTVYAWDQPNDVEYANPDWMRRYGTGGVAVTVTAGQNAQVKLTGQSVPVQ
jgi:hypothetical protein